MKMPAKQPLPAREARSGLSARLLQGGIEPDPRFSLANERTFLAWVRTSLALLAGGVAVEAFMADLFGPELRKTLAVLLLVLALFLSGGSFFRWVNVERAMRHQSPLPLPWIAPLLAAGGALAAGMMVAFVLIQQN
jgi:putative membrane protein